MGQAIQVNREGEPIVGVERRMRIAHHLRDDIGCSSSVIREEGDQTMGSRKSRCGFCSGKLH